MVFTSFLKAPIPNVSKITPVICGYRAEETESPFIQKTRYPDKLIGESGVESNKTDLREPNNLKFEKPGEKIGCQDYKIILIAL